jgi:hypothetical protein
MPEVVSIRGVEVHLAEPMRLPPVASLAERGFIGREWDLSLCKAAWDVEDLPATEKGPRSKLASPPGSEPLNFRLEGEPGMGKNELVYQLARDLEMDLYVVQGHEELTPEDLALVIVPDGDQRHGGNGDAPRRDLPLVVRASPLATALLKGGLLFFDEINRAPERSLSPLAPVLDGRKQIFSALTGLWIGPLDEHAEASFRFACALNPQYGQDLPEFIAQRALPRIEIKPPELKELEAIVLANIDVPEETIKLFREWYDGARPAKNQPAPISTRQAIQLLRYTLKLSRLPEYQEEPGKAFQDARDSILGDRRGKADLP